MYVVYFITGKGKLFFHEFLLWCVCPLADPKVTTTYFTLEKKKVDQRCHE